MCHCHTNCEFVLTDRLSEFPAVADAAEWGAARFSPLPAVSVVAAVESLDEVQLNRTVMMS
jgi:hypothetical protein